MGGGGLLVCVGLQIGFQKKMGGLKYREDGLFEWENFGWGERK